MKYLVHIHCGLSWQVLGCIEADSMDNVCKKLNIHKKVGSDNSYYHPSFPDIKIDLMELYELTSEKKFISLARRFVMLELNPKNDWIATLLRGL